MVQLISITPAQIHKQMYKFNNNSNKQLHHLQLSKLSTFSSENVQVQILA